MGKILTLIVIFAPYVIAILLLKGMTNHYEYITSNLDMAMENSYYLGCRSCNNSMKECRQKASDYLKGN